MNTELEKKIVELNKNKNKLNELNLVASLKDDTFPPYEKDKIEILDLERKIKKLENEIGEIRYNEEKQDIIDNYSKYIFNYHNGLTIPDNTNANDIFNYGSKAEVISDLIIKCNNNIPFNIGIIGKWGDGKTTLMNYVKQNINVSEKNISIIDYNASDYDENEKIWANILKTLFFQYEKEKWLSKPLYFIIKMRNNCKRVIERIILTITIFILAMILLACTYLVSVSDWSISLKIILGSFSSVTGFLIFVINILLPIIKEITSFTLPLSEKITYQMALPDYKETLGKKERFKEDLDTLIKAWCKEDKKIVLFIDDLDRCSESGIMQFFEAIQLFLNNNKNIYIIFAIDPQIMANALTKALGPINIYGFLDKYIQHYIPISNQKDYDIFIKDQIEKYAPKTFTNQEIEHIIECLSIYSNDYINPRKVIKLLNGIIMCRNYYALLYKKNNNAINFFKFISWYFFRRLKNEMADKIVHYSSSDILYHHIHDYAKNIGIDSRLYITNEILDNIGDLYYYDIKCFEKVINEIVYVELPQAT